MIESDIDDRRRAESLLLGEKQLLEMAAAGSSMSDILMALCRLVETTSVGCFCSVVLVDPTGTRLEHGAAPSLPVAIVENGTRPDERVATGRLADLARLAATHLSARGNAGPSLIIVGEVAARAAVAREPLAEVS